jgi:UDP-3-O-[3-hydroxymyristoyl] N-acetylglucosamine deacetylase
MRAFEQTTLAKPATLVGAGLHSGAPCRAVLHPAPADYGVAFRLDGALIPAVPTAVVATPLCTTLAAGGRSVGTVEHLLAALTIAGVDNARVDLDAAEPPILDGSAAPYVEAIERAGVVRLGAPRRSWRIAQPIEIRDGARALRAEPSERRALAVSIEFDDAAIGAQTLTLDLDDPHDLARLAGARTFCRLADVAAMRAAGLGRGGSLDNAVVVDAGRVLNPAGLRDPAEFALHKALDLVGDLRLLGSPVLARITARRPGHEINARLVARLAAEGALDPAIAAAPAAAHA